MKTKRITTLLVSVCLVLVLGVMLLAACAKPAPAPAPTPAPSPAPAPTPAPAPAPKPEWKPPSVVNIVSTSLAGTGFIMAEGFSSIVSSETGVLIRAQPSATDPARFTIMRQKEGDFLFTAALEVHDYARGLGTADTDGWGPQPIRLVWLGGVSSHGYKVRADSGIKTGLGLVGKRIIQFPTYPTGQSYMNGFLAFFNLKETDVKLLPVSSTIEAQKAFTEGAVDMTWHTQTSADSVAHAASPHGLYWIPLDPKNTEAWARMKQVLPIAYPYRATTGPGAPADLWGYDFHMVAYDWQNEEMVYWMTKVKTTYYAKYKGAYSLLELWTIDNALNLSAAQVPYHPGAIKYYKEIGVWKAEHDEWQAKMLAAEQKAIADWKAKHPDWKMNTGK